MEEVINGVSALDLFGAYMKITGTPFLEPEREGDPRLVGKILGLVNGSSWVSLWSNYFGRKILPGVKLVNVGNDAVQYRFMNAHREGRECPPQVNRELLADYARQLKTLFHTDAILSTCSTMNRSYPLLQKAMEEYKVPVIQIDMPMMEDAVSHGGRILIIATHGPTVESTRLLLNETAERLGRKVSFAGATVLEAFECLGEGNIRKHNELIAAAIRESQKDTKIDIVVLAQLSMSVFKLSHPCCEEEFGVPVLTSAECGFRKVRELLLAR